MFELVGGDEGFCISGETLDDGSRDRVLDGAPGLSRVRVLSAGPATFLDEG